MVSRGRAKNDAAAAAAAGSRKSEAKKKAEERAEQKRREKFLKDQRTAFMVAVETNDAKAVHDLLYCPDYPIWATGFQLAHPMIIAARNANLTLMSLLIDIGGFSVNVRECIRHYTPLHEAVRHNVVASAKFLLDRGADTALISRDHNSTPLSLAMRNHNRQMVALILSRGTVHGDKRAGIDFVTRTALHIAALNDDAGEVNIQLNMGTAPNALAKGGYTAVHLAAHFGCFRALQVLLQHLRNSALAVVQNEWKYCALHFAAMLDRSIGVQLLLEAGGIADHINLRDKEMHTPLALSVYYGRHDCAKVLLSAGADPTMLDSGGRTLLHYIVERNVSDLPMLRLLLAPPAGAIRPELDALNKQKETPLAAAFAWGNIPAGRELLAAGASLLPAGTSRTPLKMLAGYLSSGLQTDAIWNEARALLEEQLTLAESMVKAHQEGTSDLFKAERAKSKHALIMAGEKLSAHLNVEVSVRHQQAQDALELFRSAPMEVEKVLDGLDTAACAAADHPPAIPPAVPPALPPAVPSADLLGDSLFMDSPPLPDGDFIWSELASLVDDTPLFIMEQQGDFDGVWIDPLPGILEAPAAVAPAAVAVAAVAEAVPEADNASGKRKRGGEASESAAARKKRLRREALDAANPRRRWSKAAIARADAAKAYVVQAQLDGRAWGVPKQEKVVAKPVLARRDQGRVALEAKQRLQLLWEVFAPVAKEYGEASEADSCALPAEVVKEIKVLQKRIAVLEKFLEEHPPRPLDQPAPVVVVGPPQ